MASFPLTADELAAFQEDNETLLPDTCRIYRDAPTELRPGDTWTGDTETDLWTGPCSLKVIPTRRDRYDTFGEALVFQVQYRLILPADADGFIITDKVQMLTCSDTDALTRTYEIRDIHRGSQLSQRRVTLHDLGR
jgi:hypothetical protein